jgi:hypothetical protein
MIQVFYNKDGKQDFLNLALTNSLEDNLAIVYTKDWQVVFSTEVYAKNDFKGYMTSVKTKLLERGYMPIKLVVYRFIVPQVFFENESVFDEVFPELMFDEQIR